MIVIVNNITLVWKIFQACVGLNLLVALTLFVLILLAFIFFPPKAISFWTAIWFPVVFIFFGLQQTAHAFGVRLKNYQDLALARIAQTGAFAILCLPLGYLSPTAISMLVSESFSRTLAAWIILKKNFSELVRVDADFKNSVRDILRQYSKYPKFSLPSGLLTGVYVSAPFFAIGFLFSAGDVGQFSLAWRLTLLPIGVATAAISQVFSGYLAEMQREKLGGDFYFILRNYCIALLAGTVGALFVHVYGQSLVSIILGEKWEKAALMVSCFPALILSAISAGPFNTLLLVLEKQKTQLIFEVVRVVYLFVMFIGASVLLLDIFSVLKLYGVSILILNYFYIFLLLQVLWKQKER